MKTYKHGDKLPSSGIFVIENDSIGAEKSLTVRLPLFAVRCVKYDVANDRKVKDWWKFIVMFKFGRTVGAGYHIALRYGWTSVRRQTGHTNIICPECNMFITNHQTIIDNCGKAYHAKCHMKHMYKVRAAHNIYTD